jgi:hypothetical protein
MAADNLDTLFGSDIAASLQPEPRSHALVQGARYTEISILTSRDGVSFQEIDNSRLLANPVRLEVRGVATADNSAAVFFSHPTYVDSSPVGIEVIGEEGNWTAARVTIVYTNDGIILTDLTGLSVVAPYESQGGEGEGENEGVGCFGAGLDAGARPGPSSGAHLFVALTVVLLVLRMRPASRPGVRGDGRAQTNGQALGQD